MQKYTRSRSAARIGTGRPPTPPPPEVPGPAPATPSSSSSSTIPEPIRRWHSFHSRRSSLGRPRRGGAPHPATSSPPPTPPPPTGIVAGAAGGGVGADSKKNPASRFLSPPPLTSRRRFSVWLASCPFLPSPLGILFRTGQSADPSTGWCPLKSVENPGNSKWIFGIAKLFLLMALSLESPTRRRICEDVKWPVKSCFSGPALESKRS